jgi:hypothetical protein
MTSEIRDFGAHKHFKASKYMITILLQLFLLVNNIVFIIERNNISDNKSKIKTKLNKNNLS